MKKGLGGGVRYNKSMAGKGKKYGYLQSGAAKAMDTRAMVTRAEVFILIVFAVVE
jgi:hypothetical protein